MNPKLWMVAAIVVLAMPAWAGDRNLGPVSDQPPSENHEGELGYGARALINDGSFEFGECDAGSAWTCTTDTDCPNWIVYLGADAYEGNFAAQLGGTCGEQVNSNSFCQEVDIFGECLGPWLQWKWWIHTEGEDAGVFRVYVDGSLRALEPLDLASDTEGQWEESWMDTYQLWGTYELCFEFEAGTDPGYLFLDHIGMWFSPTAVEPLSFSALKSRY